MSGNRCHWKMMCRGAEGGGGEGFDNEEKNKKKNSCPEIYRVYTRQTVSFREDKAIDFYNQAQKALSERSSFDSDDSGVSRVSTLPVGLSDFLFKHSNNSRNKRHKKSHADCGAKSSQTQPRGSNIWAETENYFRPVTLSDIENLVSQSSLSSLATQSCFSIPFVRKIVKNVGSTSTVSGANLVVEVGLNATFVEEEEKNENEKENEMEMEKEKEKEKEKQLMEIDGGEADVLPPEELDKPSSSSDLHWLLGARNKILLTSERPSKKRKLLGSDAGLERLRVLSPSEGHDSIVCHVCCLGDLGEHFNQFLVCDSCKVGVHQKCYGVQHVLVGSWVCSWCAQNNHPKNGSDSSELLRPCFLCPKLGGALKPIAKDDPENKNGGFMEFAHLVCSQWMPEVYVEDTMTMEPIMNVQGIKETRRKLVCCVCKVKYGACVRCSHGTCRTSFHPICAREAKHRMEIWGKFGRDNVELRAFCSKHSEFQDITSTQQSKNLVHVDGGGDSSLSKHSPVMLLVNKPHKLKLGFKNGDKSMAHVTTSDTDSDKLGNSDIPLEQDTLVTRSSARLRSECRDVHSLVNMETLEKDNNGSANPSEPLDFVQVLKKLIDRGKAVVSDVALEIGISSDLLAGALAGDRPSLFPDLGCKIIKWLRSHAYIGTSQQNLKSGSNSAISSRVRATRADGPNNVAVAGPDNSNAVPLNSIPPRRAKSNTRILKDNKVARSSVEMLLQKNDNGIVIDDVDVNPLVPNGDLKEDGTSNGSLLHDGDSHFKDKDKEAMEKILSEPEGYQDLGSSEMHLASPKAELANGNKLDNDHAEEANISVNSNGEHPVSSINAVTPVFPDPISGESAPSSYIHPFICKRLMQLQNSVFLKQENIMPECYGPVENSISTTEAHLHESVCCNHRDHHSSCADTNSTSDAVKLDQLVKARKMGLLELSPEDEVEGQLIYFQNKLLDRAIASRQYCDELISKIVKSLPHELDDARKQKWDSVLVNQYLCGIREAKKLGRKEKRHKEAQAVLAAAAAVAAASSRMSSFRKDAPDEAAHHENLLRVNAVSGRTGPYSQLKPRAKETLSRLAVARVSSEKVSDTFQLTSGFSKEHPELCDICRRSETILNPIVVCCNCKVAVHLGCYRSVKDPTGPWYCELCEALLPSRNSWDRSCFTAQCSLCGGNTGAFRKSTDGQWVHAFCAEWLLESTFRRGQPNLVEGMETILKERDVCCICCRKLGVCIKCNYGNCQSTFHPSCARNAGFYMHLKTGGGKLQHKAYCEKHSLEQREKAETQQHGAEELKRIKQIRVELERVRLLCDRIIKREKVKRELVLCSHDILASKRDSVAFSALVRSPFFLPDVSSESATTSLRGHVDDNKSCAEAVQRSDDITVDTAVSGKRRVMLPAPMDIDQKTDDSSTSQQPCTWKPNDRVPLSGKQLPHRPAFVASRNLTDDGERRSKSRKHTETFQKELVMTSDQASVQNQRLPKGFAYVPVVCLPKEKPTACETGSHEPVEPDG